MSSVSRSSRFSAKSQVIIEAQDKLLAEQGGQISDMAKEMAMMKKLLEEAGIKPVIGTVVGTEEEEEIGEGKDSRRRKQRGYSWCRSKDCEFGQEEEAFDFHCEGIDEFIHSG